MSLGRLKLNSESVSYITESLFAMLLEPNTNVKKALEIGLRPAKKENSIDSINIHQNVESILLWLSSPFNSMNIIGKQNSLYISSFLL